VLLALTVAMTAACGATRSRSTNTTQTSGPVLTSTTISFRTLDNGKDMSVSGPFHMSDTNDGSLRIRMTPDGRDTWTFDLRLVLNFSDNSQRTFAWQGIRLDEKAPERTLPLAPARVI
jgi:hypothetical protein